MLSTQTNTSDTVNLLDLTHASVEGNGVFDVLMRAVKAHLNQEWTANRIKGTEYSTVYLSAMEATMRASLEFVLQRNKANAEVDLLKASLIKENAQVALLEQQKTNLALEAVNIPKQGILLDKQVLDIVAKTSLTTQQQANLLAEANNIPKQGIVLDKQALDLTAKTALVTQQTSNALAEGTVIANTGLKVNAEKDLLVQKTASELAQINGAGVSGTSVLGKQMALMTEQAIGFVRDAEQKAARIMVDAYNIAVTTTDDITGAPTAHLAAADIGSVVAKLKAGVGA